MTDSPRCPSVRQRHMARFEFEAAVVLAVELGAKTAREVSDMTGLRYSYMSQLLISTAKQGRIRRLYHGVYGPVVKVPYRAPAPVLEPAKAAMKAPESIIRPLTPAQLMVGRAR
jgi:predicted transcriptional regulator of viral defense system